MIYETDGSFVIRSTANLSFYTSGANERVRIDASGNVGIGNSAPSDKLHVEYSGNNYALIRNSGAKELAGVKLQNTGETRGIRLNVDVLELYDYSNSVARVSIDSSGKVGVGNASLTNTFSVEGTAYFSGLITGTVTTANNTTYVNGKTEANLNVNNAVTVSNGIYTQGGQTITGGFLLSPYDLGSHSGTLTPNPTNGNYQYILMSGSLTIYAPDSDCAIDIILNYNGSGSLSFSGYTTGVGDAVGGGTGNKYLVSIRRVLGNSYYVVKALQ
jgi:hypothetical protein